MRADNPSATWRLARGAWLVSSALQSKCQLALSLGTVRHDPRLA